MHDEKMKPTPEVSAQDALISDEALDHIVEELKEELHPEELTTAAASHEQKTSKEKVAQSAKAAIAKLSAILHMIKARVAKEKIIRSTKTLMVKSRMPKKKAQEIHSPMVEKWKLFFVSDTEEEEAFLHEMSLQGLHFKKKQGIRYFFLKDEPVNYVYHLGYYEKDKRDGEGYLQNFADAGWEDIFVEKGELDGFWHCFRLQLAAEEKTPKIFSDRLSKTALYERLLKSWQSLLVMLIICLLFMSGLFIFLFTHTATAKGWILLLCTAVVVLLAAAIIIYLSIYRKVNKKLQEFRYQ